MESCSNFSSNYPYKDEDPFTLSWICSPFRRVVDYPKWTFQENKMFEKALANLLDDHDLNTVDSLQKNIINALNNIVVPEKSIEEIKQHFQLLVEDVKFIEEFGGPVTSFNTAPPPTYRKTTGKIKHESICSKNRTTNSVDDQHKQKRKGTRWTKEEHEKFLVGLSKYGKGNWRSISRNIVLTKTPTQVASHAQKYFIRLAKISSSKLLSNPSTSQINYKSMLNANQN
ncbi:OLC1v1010460C1 [Oldenlandia corymbosa var. corymbosa]|uniref:OLC1v1010460C1 n=1 Tax=Oldenlandia corymbosa var. corymbosa TaxID=529605 RepID=A0AAV1DU45_OLDCO|nr:OLC1v1010460C1 [Oldenlandia corymbosa var. corymbosa]